MNFSHQEIFSNFAWKSYQLKILSFLSSMFTRGLGLSVVKPLLSQNFCHKCMRENSRNFHTVLREFLQFPRFFWKNFVKAMILLNKEITKELIWRNIFWWVLPQHCCVCKHNLFWKRYVHKFSFTEKISSNQVFSKNVAFTKFLPIVCSFFSNEKNQNPLDHKVFSTN